ncbi:hypothetical protein EYF80_043129 [Liparis tanakae]|uniref:Uncharacterized protein n=1 Tax=Liparis tanakae TaxID=230148 RepID=A0A4Z2G0H6_9TELE|nr:hypothetical protein EYF80_043129 [Liparis tanakae]
MKVVRRAKCNRGNTSVGSMPGALVIQTRSSLWYLQSLLNLAQHAFFKQPHDVRSELRLRPSVVRSEPSARCTMPGSVSAARMNVSRPIIPNWSVTMPMGMLVTRPATETQSLDPELDLDPDPPAGFLRDPPSAPHRAELLSPGNLGPSALEEAGFPDEFRF